MYLSRGMKPFLVSAESIATEHASAELCIEDAVTEHVAAGAETIMSTQAIVTEFSALSTDDARDLVSAAQVILKGKKDDVRNLCKPWGVQLKAQKHYRPMETIKQELKTALTKRAMKLRRETEPSAGGAATEHAETEVRADAASTPKSNPRCRRKHCHSACGCRVLLRRCHGRHFASHQSYLQRH